VNIALPSAADHQKFCDDEQNRLTFAQADSNPAPPVCQIGTAGTLTSAQYHSLLAARNTVFAGQPLYPASA
jgi:hypothetical protein